MTDNNTALAVGSKGKAEVATIKPSDPKLLARAKTLIAKDPARYTRRYIAAQVGTLIRGIVRIRKPTPRRG